MKLDKDILGQFCDVIESERTAAISASENASVSYKVESEVRERTYHTKENFMKIDLTDPFDRIWIYFSSKDKSINIRIKKSYYLTSDLEIESKNSDWVTVIESKFNRVIKKSHTRNGIFQGWSGGIISAIFSLGLSFLIVSSIEKLIDPKIAGPLWLALSFAMFWGVFTLFQNLYPKIEIEKTNWIKFRRIIHAALGAFILGLVIDYVAKSLWH